MKKCAQLADRVCSTSKPKSEAAVESINDATLCNVRYFWYYMAYITNDTIL